MRFNRLPRVIVKGFLHAYRTIISPIMPPTCRFDPTCSAYALEAVDRHGAAKGSLLAARRILRCQPWYRGPMIDPVPAAIDWPSLISYKRIDPGAAAPFKKDDDHEQP